jgi:zinc transporter 1/2/3
LILTVAIYFHTLFEGIAIGVQTGIPEFLSIAVAIGFHKWADALSMGCHYRTKDISKKLSYGLIVGQAILNVVAIGLGWIISNSGKVAEAVFLSLSAGTFLAISTL